MPSAVTYRGSASFSGCVRLTLCSRAAMGHGEGPRCGDVGIPAFAVQGQGSHGTAASQVALCAPASAPTGLARDVLISVLRLPLHHR